MGPGKETISERKERQSKEYAEYKATIKEPEEVFSDFRKMMQDANKMNKMLRGMK